MPRFTTVAIFATVVSCRSSSSLKILAICRLIPDLSIPKSSAIAFCVHQMVSSFITTCTLPSLSGRLYSKNWISLLIVAYICVELQSIQLFHYFLFQTMALCKLLEKDLLVVRHSGIKLFFRYIYIINLDVEILPG